MDNFAAPSAKHKLAYLKASTNYQPVFFRIVCLGFLLYNKVAMEVRSVAATAEEGALRHVSVSIALNLCALTV